MHFAYGSINIFMTSVFFFNKIENGHFVLPLPDANAQGSLGGSGRTLSANPLTSSLDLRELLNFLELILLLSIFGEL